MRKSDLREIIREAVGTYAASPTDPGMALSKANTIYSKAMKEMWDALASSSFTDKDKTEIVLNIQNNNHEKNNIILERLKKSKNRRNIIIVDE